MDTKWVRNSFVYLIILVAVIALFITMFPASEREPASIPLSDVVAGVKDGRVRLITVAEDKLTVDFTDRPKWELVKRMREVNLKVAQIRLQAMRR